MPSEVAVGVDGELLYLDYNTRAVRAVRPGEPCEVVETVLADVSWVQRPGAVAVGDGVVYVADLELPRVVRVELGTGAVAAYAGTGTPGELGDGGPADRAELTRPEGLALAEDGSLYIADPIVGRIRRVDADGTIWPYAGDGSTGPFVDGARADSVPLLTAVPPANGTFRLAHSEGSLWYVDADAGALRRIDLQAGTLHAVAEGFVYPWDVVAEGAGEPLVVDTIASCVRALDGSAVAGRCGEPGYEGDDALAVDARLYQPMGATRDDAGVVWIADTYNHRLRRVSATPTE